MGEFARKLNAYRRVVRRTGIARVGDLELAWLLRRRPAVLVGVTAYEVGLLASSRVDAGLKALAALKASSQIGCPF